MSRVYAGVERVREKIVNCCSCEGSVLLRILICGKTPTFHKIKNERDVQAWFLGWFVAMNRPFQMNYKKLTIAGLFISTLISAPVNCGAAEATNQFRKVVLAKGLNDPMELSVAEDGRVFFIERNGTVKIWKPEMGDTVVAAKLPVFMNYNEGTAAAAEGKKGGWEDGLIGLHLDPEFAKTGALYLYYSPERGEGNRLSRFTVKGDKLELESEKVILNVKTDRQVCCHSAGSITFDGQGNLFLSTGDNTNPFEADGYAPIDWRPGRAGWDAARSSGNRNDLRGKILRIKPKAEGGYDIPAGNLFPSDGSQGRPEIYTMGHRNPFRISVDAAMGWLYWGDVGPDAREGNELRGPAGFDEINQARGPGNFGWPFIIGTNRPYRAYDFTTKVSGEPFNPAKPINNSPNNTGATELPPAEPAWIAYPYSPSTRYPELGSGGRSAMAGPVYHYNPNLKNEHKLPAKYDKSLFIYDWMRHWFKEVKLNGAGQVQKINPFLEGLTFLRPIEMEIGPDGCVYVIEFGTAWEKNPDSQLVRIDYVESGEEKE
jgi:cytochrome c